MAAGITRAVLIGLCLAQLLAAGWLPAAELEPAPAFSLPRRGGAGQSVRLEDLKGRIVVLDFFAHWCVPCVRGSAEVETGIRAFYAARQGNARGVPVEVLAINIEAARPDRTEAFIQRAGLSEVLDDLQGVVFKRYGGSGLPYLVIVDASGTGTPTVAYKNAGFEGVAKLREIIDALGTSVVAPAVGPSPAPKKSGLAEPEPAVPAVPGTAVQKAGLDFAALWASDIFLADEMAEYRLTWPRTELSFSVSGGHIALDYVPETRLEEENDVSSDRVGFQTSDRFKLADRFTLLGGGGAYYGYMDYRSLWLDEHFRQLYSRREGYAKAHPWGYNASGGLRWEYLPAAAFLQGNVLFQHDVISPGYEVVLQPFPPHLVRFRDRYDTISGRLTLENVLTPRVRALQELQITDTTDRELRFSLQSSVNVALSEHWVGRLALCGTKENPQFESWYVSALVERDWNETWFVSFMGRFYQDTGQIENALLAENTAAPPLEALEAGVGLRWQGSKASLKLSFGPYFTWYDPPTTLSQAAFAHLYQSRDWFSTQFAFTYQF